MKKTEKLQAYTGHQMELIIARISHFVGIFILFFWGGGDK